MTQRVLAIDDDPETTGALRRLLERKGYEVREENDPRKALETAREFLPDFVILDYSMPDYHGGDVAWQLAGDSVLGAVKVIFCSGLAEAEVRSKLPPAPIPILTKPIDPKELMQLLRDEAGMSAVNFRRPLTARTGSFHEIG
jgi:two-component system OmpR family response regulator